VIALDASAAVLALLNDGDARRLVARETIAIPHLGDSELAHALRGQVRRGRIGEDQVHAAISRWARLGMHRFPAVGLLGRVWELRHNLSAYDATYVALAEALGCALVTADARLAQAPGPACAITVVRR
jgi:predicted nucleic acid-binding protein